MRDGSGALATGVVTVTLDPNPCAWTLGGADTPSTCSAGPTRVRAGSSVTPHLRSPVAILGRLRSQRSLRLEPGVLIPPPGGF